MSYVRVPSYQAHVVQVPGFTHFERNPRPVEAVNLLVMHCTQSGGTAEPDIAYIRAKGLTYNYIIDRVGTIWRLVAPKYKVNHAGVSDWPNDGRPLRGYPSVNSRSIGISWDNWDYEREPLTDFQWKAGIWLARVMMQQFPRIMPTRVRGHYEVAPGRRWDPHPLGFSMEDFRASL